MNPGGRTGPSYFGDRGIPMRERTLGSRGFEKPLMTSRCLGDRGVYAEVLPGQLLTPPYGHLATHVASTGAPGCTARACMPWGCSKFSKSGTSGYRTSHIRTSPFILTRQLRVATCSPSCDQLALASALKMDRLDPSVVLPPYPDDNALRVGGALVE